MSLFARRGEKLLRKNPQVSQNSQAKNFLWIIETLIINVDNWIRDTFGLTS